MTGSATLTGRSSSAVGTTHDASMVTPCIVISLLAAKPPSPEVVHDKAPVPPGRVFLYDHIDPSWPRMFRIASCCQLPASRPAPSVQARKAGVHPKTQAERPRYKITGTATFTGRFSSAVGTTREALKEALPHIQKSEFSSGVISPGNTSFSTCSTPEKGLASLV